MLGLAEPEHVGIRGWGGGFGGGRQQRHFGMEPVVRVEWAHCRGRVLGVVIGELCHGKEAGLVSLLVVTIHAQVLLQHRVKPLFLAVRLGMECRGAVGANSQEFQQC